MLHTGWTVSIGGGSFNHPLGERGGSWGYRASPLCQNSCTIYPLLGGKGKCNANIFARTQNDNPPPEGVFLSKIYIKSSARKQGLGKVALDFAVTWARLAGGKYLWLTVNKKNTGSFEWYVRQGFTNDSNIVIDIGGGYVMDDHKMTLPVSSLSTPSDDCHR